jgi:ubiquinone/menaquinone biosynthesis C-methylase UbiE
MSTQEKVRQWQLGRSSAEAYEQYQVPLFFAPGAQYLIDLVGLQTGKRVLDLACGTGIVARSAAARVGLHGRVVGLDLNEHMLAVAQEVSSDLLPEIQWRQGDVHDIPFPEASFDAVFCQQGLQFFKDRPAALREMRRVLAPGGRMGLNVLRSVLHNPAYELLAEALERYVGPEAGSMMRSPFPELSAGDLRELLAEAGFREVRILIGIGPVRYPSIREFLLREAGSSPLAVEIDALTDDLSKPLIHDLEGALRAYIDDEGVIFPTETHLIVAQR